MTISIFLELNIESFTEKFNKQSKLGFGAPTQRISPGNSTCKAGWGSGFSTCGNEFKLNFDMYTQLIKWSLSLN